MIFTGDFIDLLTAARLGNKSCISNVLDMFEEKIEILAKVYSAVPDIKPEMVLEVLEQIKGDKSDTFKGEKLARGIKNVEEMGSPEEWDEYIKNKFILWTNLQLNRRAKRLHGKSQVSVYIPLYVSSVTRHYNTLLAYFSSHEEVESFVKGGISNKSVPENVYRAGEILAKSLKHKGRKNLLERVRLLVSEITFDHSLHSVSTRPDQEFRILTKEFILSRPCNIKIGNSIKSAAKYKAAGKIDQSTEDEFVDRCKKHLTALDSNKCLKKCNKYDMCQEEWKELK